MTRAGDLRRWVVANAVGETVGLGLGALLGVPGQAWLAGRIPALAAALLAATGFALVEGVIVGLAQWRVVGRRAATVGRSRWIAATIAGGLTAWLAVSLPFALMNAEDGGPATAPAPEPPLVLQLAAMALAGLAAGPLLGGWQALALRRVTTHPWSWVWANSRAWAVGLPVIQLAAGGLPADAPAWSWPAAAVPTLLLAGALVGRIHGPTLLRLTERPASQSESARVRAS